MGGCMRKINVKHGKEVTVAWSGTRRSIRGIKNKQTKRRSHGERGVRKMRRERRKKEQQKDVRLEETAQV